MSDPFHEKLKMTKLATKYQQNFYELLPDWFQYDRNDHLYLKQNIGFALFGPVEINKDGEDSLSRYNYSSNSNPDADIFKIVTYDKKSYNVINTIYNQIVKHSTECQGGFIHVGIIYNIIFNRIVIKKSKGNSNNCDQEHNEICPMPLFKVKNLDAVWYIDNSGRIYKNWEDYLQNNKLPKCTMVFPKDGIYQCNPNYKITEQSSTVWIEVADSPACSLKDTIVKICDNVSNVLTLGATVGLGVTSLFTPVGPMVATAGLITGIAGGTWNITRKSYQLIDRTKHKQSINPVDRNAFPAWFEITSTALTLGTTGGTMFLCRAIAKGESISSIAKIACNSMTIGNLTINGVNVVYQGCNLIGKCAKKEDIGFSDIFMFLSHVLFFGNAVVNVKLANELIEQSRGTILERFKNSLRFNRLRKEFNSINAQNGSESIVYGVNKVIEKHNFLGNLLNKIRCNEHIQMIYRNGQIRIKNIVLLDPLVFACSLLTGTIGINQTKSQFVSMDGNATHVITALTTLLSQLLADFYKDDRSTLTEKFPDIERFNNIVAEMKDMTNARDILHKIFKISTTVVKYCNDPKQFLVEAVYFIWEYSKANLKKCAIDTCSSIKDRNMSDALTKVITFVYEVADAVGNDLFEAFYMYMLNTEPLNYM